MVPCAALLRVDCVFRATAHDGCSYPRKYRSCRSTSASSFNGGNILAAMQKTEPPTGDNLTDTAIGIERSVDRGYSSITRRRALSSAGTTAILGAGLFPVWKNPLFINDFAARGLQEEREWLVSNGFSELLVKSDGTLVLSGQSTSDIPQTLAISLPTSAKAAGATAFPAQELPAGSMLALRWLGGIRLVIWPASSDESHSSKQFDSKGWTAWAGGITDGFLIEVSAPVETDEQTGQCTAASLDVDLRSGGRWYGGAHMLRQLWPLDRAQLEIGPYYPFDHGPNGLGSVIGYHWISSRGTLIAVDPKTPFLHVGLNPPIRPRPTSNPRFFGVGIQHLTQETLPFEDNFQMRARVGNRGDGKLHIQARASWNDPGILHPWQQIETPELSFARRSSFSKSVGKSSYAIQNHDEATEDVCTLRIAIAATPDVRTATLAALRPLSAPKHSPPPVVLERPTWTTWATSHADVNQYATLTLGNAILENGYRPGVIEIDDRWQSRYGDLEFDATKFPDPKGMVEQLHSQGFLVTVWVMPFLQDGSKACAEARRLGYLIEGGEAYSMLREISVGGAGERLGSAVKILVDKYDFPPGHWQGGGGGGQLSSGQLRWWGTQPVRAIDLTNDAAIEWFVSRLRSLKQRVGLDGFKFDAGEPCFLPTGAKTSRPLNYPAEYTQLWVHKVVSQFKVSEVRSAAATTGYGGLIRMGDRDTIWGVDNGLRSLIPTLLTSAVLGYPFCLPDMVGGNAYWGQYPDTDLMVRWAQVSVLMPAVQWSIPPWEVSSEAKEACKKADLLREEILLPRMSELVTSATGALVPLCRPLWWLDPKDEETFGIDDQFVVGDDIIVAPVVTKDTRQRKVYLPAGVWIEWNSNIVGEADSRNKENIFPTQVFDGPCWIEVDAPLEKLPVFIKHDIS